jgi:hypothetical protein
MAASASSWNDEQVRAFVDGQLDAASAARLASQVQQDLALAERVARQRALRRQGVKEPAAQPAAPAPAATEPVAMQPAPAAQGGKARSAPSLVWWSVTLAAVVIAALAGWSVPRESDQTFIPDANGLAAGGRLAKALDERISAEGSKEGGVLVSLSFRAGDGRYCRTFSLDTGIDGLACRNGRTWQVESIGRPPQDAQAGPYREASSELSPSVIAALSRWQAGNALTPEEERRVRDNDWQ